MTEAKAEEFKKVACDNCDWTGTDEDKCDETPPGFRPVYRMHNIHERVEPGEEMPAGECPECGACCHLVEEEKKPVDGDETDEITDALVALRVSAKSQGASFAKALSRSRMHFEAETGATVRLAHRTFHDNAANPPAPIDTGAALAIAISGIASLVTQLEPYARFILDGEDVSGETSENIDPAGMSDQNEDGTCEMGIDDAFETAALAVKAARVTCEQGRALLQRLGVMVATGPVVMTEKLKAEVEQRCTGPDFIITDLRPGYVLPASARIVAPPVEPADKLKISTTTRKEFKALMPTLRALGIAKLEWEFNGEGDDGYIEPCVGFGADGEAVVLTGLPAGINLDDLAYSVLDSWGLDWVNNEGGGGSIYFHVDTGLLEVDGGCNEVKRSADGAECVI